MSSGVMEVIDLTDTSPTLVSTPEIPAEPATNLGRRERRRLAALARQDEPSSNNSSNSTTIIISDDDEQNLAENGVGISIKRKKRRRNRKDKRKEIEDGEIEAPEGITQERNSDMVTASPGNYRTRRKEKNKRHASPPLSFYIDDKPDEHSNLLEDATPMQKPNGTTDPSGSGLLLPDHVHLDAFPAGVELDAAKLSESDEDDDFIYFVDENRLPTLRYYKDPEEKKERPDLVCSHCGEDGHKFTDCRIVVCLVCGAKDEHQTRSCPISKTCFTCGMKGHVSKDCPDRRRSYRGGRDEMNCERCGSHLHNFKECPTLWRIYEYVDDAKRKQVLMERRTKRDLPIGGGGEGYVGEDVWCYNCGDAGHLGDDCREQQPLDHPREPSAFGRYNASVGPFADDHPESSRRQTKSREWEVGDTLDDGYGFAGPVDVGRKGRDKERERMRKRAKEIDSTQDDEDWFASRKRPKQNRERADRDHRKRDEKSRVDPTKKRSKIEISIRNQTSKFDFVSPSDKLISRISSPPRDKGSTNDDIRRDRGTDGRRDKGRHGNRNRDREHRNRDERRSRDDYYDRSKPDAGPSSSRQESEQGAKDLERREDKSRQQYYGGYGR